MEQTFWNIMEQTKLFPLAVSAVFPTIAALYLNDWELKIPISSTTESALLFQTSSLVNCDKLPVCLNIYHYIQLICTWVLQYKYDLLHQ